MTDWTEGRTYGPEFARVTRGEILGSHGKLMEVIQNIRFPGSTSARRLNAAKSDIIKGKDLPEDLVSSVLKSLTDPDKADLGDGVWIGRASELLEQVEDYLLDLKRFYRDEETRKQKEEKKD